MHHLTAAACIAMLAASVSAQSFKDTFSVPTIVGLPPVLGWTIQAGSFTVTKPTATKSGRLIVTGGTSSYSWITKDGLTAKNCVLDLEVYHSGVSGTQFGGLVARFTSSSTTLHCKIQQNGGTVPLFNRVFLYEYPGGSVYKDLPTALKSAFIRMIVVGKEYWMQVDANLDGIFEQTFGPKPLASEYRDKLGIVMYGTTEVDNFEFFDAVLKEKTGAVPQVGKTFDMRLYAPRKKITPFRAVLSLGNKGFPWGSRSIPLSLDPVLDLSILFGGALGLTGVTDATGLGLIPLKIPNDPALKNAALYSAAITIDGTKPMSTANISNDLYFKIQ